MDGDKLRIVQRKTTSPHIKKKQRFRYKQSYQRSTNVNFRTRKRHNSSLLADAPLNTTQFLMNDHDLENVELDRKFGKTSDNSQQRSRFESNHHSSFYSEPEEGEEEEEFETQQFMKDFNHEQDKSVIPMSCCSTKTSRDDSSGDVPPSLASFSYGRPHPRFEHMTRTELIFDYLQLESSIQHLQRHLSSCINSSNPVPSTETTTVCDRRRHEVVTSKAHKLNKLHEHIRLLQRRNRKMKLAISSARKVSPSHDPSTHASVSSMIRSCLNETDGMDTLRDASVPSPPHTEGHPTTMVATNHPTTSIICTNLVSSCQTESSVVVSDEATEEDVLRSSGTEDDSSSSSDSTGDESGSNTSSSSTTD